MGSDGPIDGPRQSLERLPLAALAAVGAGLGGLTFFTFMGGAITVARFRGAGLSGTKAVALVPTSDLLAVGAQELLLPTLIAVVALLPFVAYANHRKNRRRVLTLLGLGGLGLGIAVQWPVDEWPSEEVWAVAALFVIAGCGGLAVDELAKEGKIPEPAPTPVPRRSQALATVLLFLVAALFVAVVSYGRAYAHPSVHPMAIMRANGQPGLWGIYVGESGGRVWIGKVVLDSPGSNHGRKSAGRIIGLPRSEVSDIAIGASLPLSEAVSTGPRLLRALVREHAR